jgi:hypothetical protein
LNRKEEGMTKNLLKLLLGAALFCGGMAIAQKPVQNINPHHHPNLAAAQRLSEQAYQKIIAAQEANEWDMEGHAQKAKELLDQVNQQLRLAADWANKNHK